MSNTEFLSIIENLKSGNISKLTRNIEGQNYTRLFIPKERLILLGGGHIAKPLCTVAAMLDFSVIVVDDRPSFANTVRFSDAEQVICDSFENAIESININENDYICVITRGHRYDAECLRAVLKGIMPTYIGMIGSKRRVKGLLQMLNDEGFAQNLLSEIHTPIGLSIGAQTPPEIAVSICAELIAHRRSLPNTLQENSLTQTNVDNQLLDFLANGECKKVLMLVYDTCGSTPAKSGALMVIDENLRTFGTIGGGCGEAAAIAKAKRILGTNKNTTIQVDMDNDVASGLGMVCGGTMKIYLEDISK